MKTLEKHCMEKCQYQSKHTMLPSSNIQTTQNVATSPLDCSAWLNECLQATCYLIKQHSCDALTVAACCIPNENTKHQNATDPGIQRVPSDVACAVTSNTSDVTNLDTIYTQKRLLRQV